MVKYKFLLLLSLVFGLTLFLGTYWGSHKSNVVHMKKESPPSEHFDDSGSHSQGKHLTKFKKKQHAIKFVETKVLFPRVIYNRVGKCGSRSMQNVIAKLSEKNGYQFYLSNISSQTRLPALDLRNEVKLIYSVETPMLYSRHIVYINFAKYGFVPPVYINMIRDPIERFSSQYHFKRNGDMKNPGLVRSLKPMDIFTKQLNINDCILKNYTECSAEKLWYIVPYFCGQDVMCKRPSIEAVQRAKRHLLDNYLVVGFVEDFEGTLQVFEKLMPFYFKGAVEEWKNLSDFVNQTSTYKKKVIRPEARNVLLQRMEYEYDFYRFAYAVFRNLKSQLQLK